MNDQAQNNVRPLAVLALIGVVGAALVAAFLLVRGGPGGGEEPALAAEPPVAAVDDARPTTPATSPAPAGAGPARAADGRADVEAGAQGPGGALVGRVIDAEGAPVAEADVGLIRGGDSGRAGERDAVFAALDAPPVRQRARTDAAGSFRLRGLGPAAVGSEPSPDLRRRSA